ncbi:YcaO-like family protein [Nakamurella sp. PAMC28650]|uniref:YcaO-like family protein n=1 Tax=Nakamurella sp. PAMC28650 TaxID=2762325 RepID=UPI00164D20E0|nr:YcaO-like family protein [Nakamurella sp. PAMC28650]QNK79459.1 YcaO-like family protein [Nakamurella sp. PAMC28650]
MTPPVDVHPAPEVSPDVLEAYRRALNSVGDVGEWRLDGFDRTGVPVAAAVWTGHPDGFVEAHGVGYGPTWTQASVGALGEVAERVVTAAELRSLAVRVATYRELSAECGAGGVADPLTLTLPAGSDYHPDRPIAWVPAVRWRSGEQVMVPLEFVANDPSGLTEGLPAPLITPITNGLGAGDTVERAVGHALLELVQRDGDTVSFRAMDQGQVIELDSITDPTALASIAAFRAVGIEPIVKLASTEFAYVVYAMGRDRDDRPALLAPTAIGEAGHPDLQSAISSALLEFASSRARRAFAFGDFDQVRRLLPDYADLEMTLPVGSQEPRALRTMQEWSEMSADAQRELAEAMLGHEERRLRVSELPSPAGDRSATPAALLATMLQRLSDFDVLTVAGRLGDIFAAKVIVPGLEVETMSYLRIGGRVLQRLLDRRSPLVGLGRPDRPSRLPVRLTDAAAARIGAPAWLDRDEVDKAVGRLYPLYREPRRHAPARLAVPAR